MVQVLDYVGRPGALTIIQAGYAGAVRYCGFPDNPKCTDRLEFEDYSHHGDDVGMALVYEGGKNDSDGGRTAGRVAGAVARKDATERIGWPTWRPIYMAIDKEIVGADQHATVMDYLRGAAEELGGVNRTGVYGQYSVVRLAIETGVAAYAWQTAAWSGGLRYDRAHLYQHVGYVYPGGVECDVNDVLQTDWGQHNYVPAHASGAARLLKEGQTMQLQPGSEMSQTLTYPGAGFELVINVGWVTMDINAIKFIGRPPATGVNWVAPDFTGQNGDPFRIDPARPLVIDLDQYPNAVSIEINYTATDTRNLASAGFRAK